MPTPATRRYHAALSAARDAALTLTGDQARLLLEILDEYGREIERLVAAGFTGWTYDAVLREVSALVDAMSVDMATTTGQAITLTARQMAEVQALATAELIAAHGVDLAVSAAFAGTGARAAAAVLARPELAEAFVTIRLDAKQAANRILTRGLARGAPSTAVARELRQYIAMPQSLIEGDMGILADRRRIGYAAIEALGYERTPENLALVRSEASQIAHRAMRIARTETMTAQHEALVQGAIDSPVVGWLHWELSYRHDPKYPCACEAIADLDLYGHGPGMYDPRNTPIRPHPHCFCVVTSILKPESEWGQDRGPVPEPVVPIEVVAEGLELAPSVQASFIRAVEAGRSRVAAPELVGV